MILNQKQKEEIDKINQKDDKLSIQELVDKRIKEVVYDRQKNTPPNDEIEHEDNIIETLKKDISDDMGADEPENTTETNVSKKQNKQKNKRKRRKKRKK